MPASDSEIDLPKLPVFWVGAAGFSTEQRAVIEDALHDRAELADWRLCQFGEADAWLVNGANCRLLPNGNIRINPGLVTEASVKLDMNATHRPVAFSLPIADPDLEPHCTFDPSSVDSVRQTLAQFDSSLGFVRAEFLLGAEVVERGAALRHGVFHVSCRNKLLAVLDFWHGEGALSPRLDPAEVEQAVWSKRPKGAHAPPPGFLRSTPAQLAWNYVRRSEENLLPPRYQHRTIYYRRSPRVPLSWLADSHLAILKHLSSTGARRSELAERTGVALEQLDRDIACLFYAGAITTTHSKAAPPALVQAHARRPFVAEHAAAQVRERGDSTVRARLDQLFPRTNADRPR